MNFLRVATFKGLSTNAKKCRPTSIITIRSDHRKVVPSQPECGYRASKTEAAFHVLHCLVLMTKN